MKIPKDSEIARGIRLLIRFGLDRRAAFSKRGGYDNSGWLSGFDCGASAAYLSAAREMARSFRLEVSNGN